ncbi:MAG: DUF1329 domain-containing protein [Nevskiales bacterium]
MLLKPGPAISAALLLWIAQGVCIAQQQPEQASELGKSLTPLGAIQAGNEDGSIPPWEGGLTEPPANYQSGGLLTNPFPDDKPEFVITSSNANEYQAFLTPGQLALFKQYPDSFNMPVYKTRRTAALPQFIYDETVKNPSRAKLVNDGNGISGTVHGFPFPVPESGMHAIWNHVLRYNTTGYRGYTNSAVVHPDGGHKIVRSYIEFAMRYNRPDVTLENFDNKNQFIFIKTVSPPSAAGEAGLIHVPLDRKANDTGLWVYNPGQRRTRRVGEVGYDNPITELDGLLTHDQVDMFNGALDRYNFKLLGKKELYVPYNNYELYSQKYKYEDLLQRGHMKRDLVRYERHRVWIVEANVREGESHIYPRRVFYIDEDSWQILMQDMYDSRGEFWRTAESYAVVFYQIPVLINLLQVHYDLQSRQYVVLNMTNEEKKLFEWDVDLEPNYFNPQNLKKFATRTQ